MADGSLLLATGFWLRGDRQRGQGRSGIIELLALSLHLHLHAAQSLSLLTLLLFIQPHYKV